MILSTTTLWVCRVVISVVLIRALGFGPLGVWIGMFSDWAVRALLYTRRFLSGKWVEHQVVKI